MIRINNHLYSDNDDGEPVPVYVYSLYKKVVKDDGETELEDDCIDSLPGAAFDTIHSIAEDTIIKGRLWVYKSSSEADFNRDWLIAYDETDYVTGYVAYYRLFIRRVDGQPLSGGENRLIESVFRV